MSEHQKKSKNNNFKMERSKEKLKKVGKKQQKTRFFRVIFVLNCFKLIHADKLQKKVFFRCFLKKTPAFLHFIL